MISIIVLVRDAREFAAQCLQSLLIVENALHLEPAGIEYLLIDDCSDPSAGVAKLMHDFRAASSANVRIIRFREHRHYAHGVAAGLSAASGESILFFSHDMIVPPACVRTLLEAAAHGGDIVRPRSQHMDGAAPVQLAAPLPLRHGGDVAAFAALVRRIFGISVRPQRQFIGDAMLIKRSVIERIGVFDTRFFGFMADIDFGLRARRAGFAVVTAMGAWLHHLGGGFGKALRSRGESDSAIKAKNRADAAAAYQKLRTKWNADLPDAFEKLTAGDFDRLLGLPPGPYDAFVPPIALDRELCDML